VYVPFPAGVPSVSFGLYGKQGATRMVRTTKAHSSMIFLMFSSFAIYWYRETDTFILEGMLSRRYLPVVCKRAIRLSSPHYLFAPVGLRGLICQSVWRTLVLIIYELRFLLSLKITCLLILNMIE